MKTGTRKTEWHIQQRPVLCDEFYDMGYTFDKRSKAVGFIMGCSDKKYEHRLVRREIIDFVEVK